MMIGDGLSASSGAFAVNVDDSSIETSSDSLQVKNWWYYKCNVKWFNNKCKIN